MNDKEKNENEVEEVYTPPVETPVRKLTVPASSIKQAEEAKKPVIASVAQPVKVDNTGKGDHSISISTQQMFESEESAVTAIMEERIRRHIKFLSGESVFRNKEESIEEQLTFIETVANSTTLPYKQYVKVTTLLIGVIRENEKTFKSGAYLRFTHDLNRKIPDTVLQRYQSYMQYLVRLAVNWSSRARLKSLIDVASVTRYFSNETKQKIFRLFQEITSS